MRARNIKPGFFKNEYLAECDPLARILFAGLWCMADREGRLELRPKRIKAELLPYDNCDIMNLLEQLRHHGFIIAYQANGLIYLSITTFTEHQNCHIKESESTIPAPDEHGVSTVLAGPLTDSLLPLTESPIPYTENPIPKSGARSPNGSRVKARNEFSEDFLSFWKSYPKRVGKDAAWRAWKKRIRDMPTIGEILKSIEMQKMSEQWTKDGGQYIPNPATWINRGSWADELPKNTFVGGNGGYGSGYKSRHRIPEPVSREDEEAIERINRMARELAQKTALNKTKPDA